MINVRPIKHRERKHFMERANGPYGYGTKSDASETYPRHVSSRYGQRCGIQNSGRRTVRELQYAAEKNDLQ